MRKLIPALVVVATVCAARADTYLVAPDGTGDFPTIQAAVDAAGAGDVIELADGVFRGDGNRDIRMRSVDFAIRSQSDDPAACIIDCEGTPATPHRGFFYPGQNGPRASLRGLTIRNAWSDTLGGAIFCESGPWEDPLSCVLVLENCRLLDSAATCGGGIGAGYLAGDLEMTDCEVAGNAGGGVCWQDSEGPVHLRRCTIAGNDGPGVDLWHWAEGTEMRLTGCDVTGNSGHGLRVAVDFTTMVVDSCRILANGGNGIWITGSECQALYLSHSLLADNGESGVFVWEAYMPIHVERTTIAGNEGPGVDFNTGYMPSTITTTVIAANGAESVHWGVGAANLTISCSDFHGNRGGDWGKGIDWQLGLAGNFSANPYFCSPGTGDYTLAADSPCLPGNHPQGWECGTIGAYGVGCPPLTGVPSSARAPRVTLHAPRPNPFNPVTSIVCELARPQDVRLTICTPAGEQVAVLHAGPLPAGRHELRWRGRDDRERAVASGIYLCRLEAEGRVLTRKLTLLR